MEHSSFVVLQITELNVIQKCLERALKEDENIVVTPPPTFTLRRIMRCMGYIPIAFFFLFVAIMLFVCGILLLFFVFPSVEMYVSGALQPHGYTIFRGIRLATLPLHRYFNITSKWWYNVLLCSAFRTVALQS